MAWHVATAMAYIRHMAHMAMAYGISLWQLVHLQIDAALRFLQGLCKCLQRLQSASSSVSQSFHGFVGQLGTNDTIPIGPITVNVQFRTSTINALTIHTLTTKGTITVAVIVTVCVSVI